MTTPQSQAEYERELREKIVQSVKEAYHDGKWGTGSNGSVKPSEVIDWHTDTIMQLVTRRSEGMVAEDEWHNANNSMPDEGELVLARLVWPSGKEIYAVLEHKEIEDNSPWLYDGGELSFSVTVTHWKRFDRLAQLTTDKPYNLALCDACVQMTNHLSGVCQKCKPKEDK